MTKNIFDTGLHALLLDKPVGITSFDAVKKIEIIFRDKTSNKKIKVGHTGTLDKQASGLLILLIGKSTRLSNYFLKCDKSYDASICLGRQTDTLDSDGACIETKDLPDEAVFKASFDKFKGAMMQVPPMYSAIHVKGKRLYQYARDEQTPTVTARPIVVHESCIHSQKAQYVDCSFSVSSGTYIRALARDIALDAGSVGYLSALRRTCIANIDVKNARTLDELQNNSNPREAVQQILMPADVLLQKIIQAKIIYVSQNDKARENLAFGRMPEILNAYVGNDASNRQNDSDVPKHLFIYDELGFLAFYEVQKEKLKLVVHTAFSATDQ